MLDNDPSINNLIWDKLYNEAEQIIGTSIKEFDHSIRHVLVLNSLRAAYEKIEPERVFKPLPLACHRLSDPDYVEWHATDRILETLFTDPSKSSKFTLLTNHRCTRVIMKPGKETKNTVEAAEIRCLLPLGEGRDGQEPTFFIRAKAYVIACGSVGTAQVSVFLYLTSIH